MIWIDKDSARKWEKEKVFSKAKTFHILHRALQL